MPKHTFTKDELIEIFDGVKNKTLGSVDKNNVFDKTKDKPKITGIAGDVVEQSILGYPADNKQEADLVVNGWPVELKTTGIRRPKRGNGLFEAKEPMSITAVSINKIVKEEFFTSNFWHKLEKMLLVFYHYDSEMTVPAAEYANFLIKGYTFHEFNELDEIRLKNDWELVRDFLINIQETTNNPEEHYHRLSSELRSELTLIDTAPKYPNPPRFRLKRSTVSSIVGDYFGEASKRLSKDITSMKELDSELRRIADIYRNKTVQEIMNQLGIDIKLNKKGDVSKNISEQIVCKMFGVDVKKLSKIELFDKLDMSVKTITQTSKGKRTEDTKFINIDFENMLNQENEEESQLLNYFLGKQFLYVVFEETQSKSKLLDNKFIGFKRFVFPDEFIKSELQKLENEIKDLILNDKLVDVPDIDSKTGKQVINKTGVPKSAPNFPKSRTSNLFLRGTSSDSTKKPLTINGVDMYYQQVWIKGKLMVEMLNYFEIK
ncbi:restriction endonuclease [Vagococcus coleopterorum]|uniref:Restriction endonuclease n=1 Tax=Vagococcus coleopterorum TaxID=2714946 RepID=A0A6G8AL60_9ENTE|nr:MutH/Sau3AI family endonuclease [Vagococcus coleopterorum]QIL45665.1 restriction endonuclease [Vagococcus coleopterorum]